MPRTTHRARRCTCAAHGPATCPRCGVGHLTRTPGALLPRARYCHLNDRLIEIPAVPTVLDACDRCEFVTDVHDREE